MLRAAAYVVKHGFISGCRPTGIPFNSGTSTPFVMQLTKGFLGGVDHNDSEPTISPWVKVLERPGEERGHLSEEVHVQNPYSNKDSQDVSDDVPEKNYDTQPQTPMTPDELAAADSNTQSDSVRILAGKLNEAVGGDADFPKTGGASVREMASEIGQNIGEKLGGRTSSGNSSSDS